MYLPSSWCQDDLPDTRRPHINTRRITFADDIRQCLDDSIIILVAPALPESDSMLYKDTRVEHGHSVPAREYLKRSQSQEAILVGWIFFERCWPGLFVYWSMVVSPVFDKLPLIIPSSVKT